MDLSNATTFSSDPQLKSLPTGEVSTKYQYTPIDPLVDSIRLILLQPKTSDDIRCQLVHVAFADKPRYKALSYTWGSEEDLKSTTVDGAKMQVRSNLYWALYHLRTLEVQMIWADAICIDQNNANERNRQVEPMAFIYTRAEAVLMWLGRFIRRNWGYREFETLIDVLCDCNYWRRVWIIQEIGLAINSRVIYGSEIEDASPGHGDSPEIINQSWSEFLAYIQSPIPLSDSDSDLDSKCDGFTLILKLAEQREGRHGDMSRLEQLIETFVSAQCSEPHDKIYGFLGLAHDCYGGNLKVDYSNSLFGLYEEVMKFQHQAKPFENGLSSSIDRSMRLVRFSQIMQKSFQGAINAEASMRKSFGGTSSTMSARAHVEGVILHSGPSYRETVSSFEANKNWKFSSEKHYHTSKDLRYLRGLDESYTIQLVNMKDVEVAKYCCIYSQDSRGKRCTETWLPGPTEREPDIEVMPAVKSSICFHRGVPFFTEPRRFLASNRLMGLGPSVAQEGDLICSFWGCDIIVVLRAEMGSNLFEIIGRADLAPVRTEREPALTIQEKQGQSSMDEDVINIRMDIETLQLLTC